MQLTVPRAVSSSNLPKRAPTMSARPTSSLSRARCMVCAFTTCGITRLPSWRSLMRASWPSQGTSRRECLRMDAKRKALDALSGRGSAGGYGTKYAQNQSPIRCQSRNLLKRMAGTTRLELATSAVTGGTSPAGARRINRLRVRLSATVGVIGQRRAPFVILFVIQRSSLQPHHVRFPILDVPRLFLDVRNVNFVAGVTKLFC